MLFLRFLLIILISCSVYEAEAKAKKPTITKNVKPKKPQEKSKKDELKNNILAPYGIEVD